MGNIISRLPSGGSNNGNGIEIKNGKKISAVSGENIEAGNFVEYVQGSASDFSRMFSSKTKWTVQDITSAFGIESTDEFRIENIDDAGNLFLGILKNDSGYLALYLKFVDRENGYFKILNSKQLLNSEYNYLTGMENGGLGIRDKKAVYWFWGDKSADTSGYFCFPYNLQENGYNFEEFAMVKYGGVLRPSLITYEKVDKILFIENTGDKGPFIYLSVDSGVKQRIIYNHYSDDIWVSVDNFQDYPFVTNRAGYKVFSAFTSGANSLTCIVSNGSYVYKDIYTMQYSSSTNETVKLQTYVNQANTVNINIFKTTMGMIKSDISLPNTGVIVSSAGLITDGEHKDHYLCHVFGVVSGSLSVNGSTGESYCSFYTTKPPLIKRLKYSTIIIGFEGENVSSCYMMHTYEKGANSGLDFIGSFDSMNIVKEDGSDFSSNDCNVIAAGNGKFYLISLENQIGEIMCTDICHALAIKKSVDFIDGVTCTNILETGGEIYAIPIVN